MTNTLTHFENSPQPHFIPFPRLLLLFALLLSAAAVAAAQQDLNAPIPFDPAAKVGKLENGLTYYIRRNTKPEKKVELRLAVNAGSILERDDQQGLAHFVEHMAFNGTKNFEKNELVSYLQSIGVRFGADLNAYTSFDETVYMLSIPTDKPELLDKGMLILSDWASGITFDPAEIDKERGVVLEELRLGKGAGQRMRDRYFPKLFKGSRYAERLPIGKEQILKTFKPQTLRDFYDEWYRPELMAVVVVGDIDPEVVEKDIQKYFSGIRAKRKNETGRKTYGVPDHKETLVAVESDKEAPFVQAQILIKKPATHVKTLGDLREETVRSMFVSMLNSRLDELRQSSDPPFVFGAGGFQSLVRAKGAYVLFGVTGEGKLADTLNALLIENRRVAEYGFTKQELARSEAKYLTGLENRYNEREKTESSRITSMYVRNFLTQSPDPGVEFEYDFAKRVLPGISLDEVNALAKDTITPENRVIVVTGPEKPGLTYPTSEELLALLDRTAQARVEPYQETTMSGPLVGDLPSTAKIVSESEDKRFGIKYWTLSNGIKVALKETDFKSDQILMRAFSPGGLSQVPDKDAFDGEYVSRVVGAGGVRDISRIELTKALAGKRAGVSLSISDLYEYAVGSAAPKDLETMFQLTYLYLTAANPTEETLSSVVSKEKQLMLNLRANPQTYFSEAVARIMAQNHPRFFGLPTEEQLDGLKLAEIKKIYKDRYGDASDFTFIFVGNVSAETLKPLTLKYLGNLPGKNRTEQWKDLGIRPPAGPLTKEIRKGVDQKSFVNIVFTEPAKYIRKDHRLLAAVGELLTIKLIEILREEKGGVYGVGARGGLMDMPYPHSNFTISFPCGPENVDSLVKAALEELEKIRNGDIKDEDVHKVIEARLVKAREDLKENNYWLGTMFRHLARNDPLSSLEDIEKRTNAITKEDLQRVARKYIDPSKMLKFVLLPEQQAKAGDK